MKRWLFPIILLGVAGVWGYHLLQTPTLDEAAKAVLTALLEDRPEDAYRYIHESQKEHLTRDQFAALWRKVIAPRFKGFTPKGPVKAQVLGYETQGIATVDLQGPNGKEADFQLSVYVTDDGPRFDPFQLLLFSWRFEWTNAGNDVTAPPHDANINGLAEDIPKLREIGIEAISSPFSGAPPLPLDDLLRLYNAAKQESARLSAMDR
jgi:hypothetical protein